MNVSFVMTLLGKDQPGIIDAIAGVVASHGGNWQESQMARLSGRFAGFISISVPENQALDLQSGLLALAHDGLDLRVDRVDKTEPEADMSRASLELVGQDRPGILREITGALAREGVNVVRLNTGCTSAPMSGEVLFKVEAELLCPAALSFESLREALEQLGQDMMVEVTVAETGD
jgi:glycine cleavage system regulatory protein